MFGRLIAFKKKKKLYLALGVVINILFLGVFKYAGFFTQIASSLMLAIGNPGIPIPQILLPIGISFYTFQAVSYLIDIYRKEAEVQMNIANLGLFISLFPQLIAGPIVRYHDIATQINKRTHSTEKFSQGVMRFVLGLAKKVLIANNLAIVADYAFTTPSESLTTLTAWVGIAAYTFQIYYDFAGYSDMAIGLARMFGFELLENFNFPYIAKSIQEFWRRWHISLSSWFRDYLYIPLGGNRIGIRRTYLNLFIVFFVTGLWHGSSWNFVAWGLLHGFFIIVERLGLKKMLEKLPGIVAQAYTLFIAMMAWVLFRAETFGNAAYYFKALFGRPETTELDIRMVLHLNTEFIASIAIAVFGAMGGFIALKKIIASVFSTSDKLFYVSKTIAYTLFIIAVLMVTTTYLANNSYNPFIYFRF